MTLSKQLPRCLLLPLNEFTDALADEVDHLTDAHQDADGRRDHHEEGENLFLSGP